MDCEWCKKECDGTIHAVVEGQEYIVCAICLNLLANHEYDTLNERIESVPQYCELKKKAKELEIGKMRD